jgi:GT2 family glycosyltransferase
MNREEALLDTLRDLKALNFPDFEVIVVDQSDRPNRAAENLLAEFDVSTRYCSITQFRGLPEARNFGWRMATRDIVLYIDDDISCEPNFLQEHFNAHLKNGVAMVAGGITEARGDKTRRGGTGSFNWWTATSARNFHLPKEGFCLQAPGGNFSVRRMLLETLGGFDENLSVGAALYEETELALRCFRAGYSCWFAPEAHVTHFAAPTGGCRVGRDIARYTFGMGHNRAILIFRHLRPWHRPTAILRMLAYGLSYSRADRSFAPFFAAIRGLRAGRVAAKAIRSDAANETRFRLEYGV